MRKPPGIEKRDRSGGEAVEKSSAAIPKVSQRDGKVIYDLVIIAD